MQMKLFEALNMKDAIRSVKNEFGNEAVILNTKKKKCEDSGQDIIEITAAKMEAKKIESEQNGFSGLVDQDIVNLNQFVKQILFKINSLDKEIAKKRDLEVLESHFYELKSIFLEGQKEQNKNRFKNVDPALKKVVDRLYLMGISSHLTNHIVSSIPPYDTISKKKLNEDEKFELYRSYAISWMLKKITVTKPIGSSNISDIHAFIGSCGSGKSSIVCKIATELFTKENKKVLILSLDNAKLAATDQLRVFSKVVNVPFEMVSSAAEIKSTILKYSDLDCVLIDTSGKSPKRNSQLNDLKEINSLDIPIDFHLVLSATEKEIQLDKNIRYFSSVGFKSLVFSKLDESFSYGEIFNVLDKWKKPVSYFGIGTSLTDSIEVATKERIIERIFGL